MNHEDHEEEVEGCYECEEMFAQYPGIDYQEDGDDYDIFKD